MKYFKRVSMQGVIELFSKRSKYFNDFWLIENWTHLVCINTKIKVWSLINLILNSTTYTVSAGDKSNHCLSFRVWFFFPFTTGQNIKLTTIADCIKNNGIYFKKIFEMWNRSPMVKALDFKHVLGLEYRGQLFDFWLQYEFSFS